MVRLFDKPRSCKCGHATGHYLDDNNAVYIGGDAVPLGFANSTLVKAVYKQPIEGMGERFEAFVIPVKCPTFKKVKAVTT